MAALDVALYAEGGREDSTGWSWSTAPGEVLTEEEHGPAHLLCARAIAHASTIPRQAIRFVAPISTADRGSMLYSGPSLRRILTLHDLPGANAQLVVVLVDQDDEPRRRTDVDTMTEGIDTPVVVAVAVKEFEAWLIADHRALNAAIAVAVEDPGPKESLPAGRAKELLVRSARGRNESDVRTTLANTCDLEVVKAECASFARFLADLAKIPA